jgi:hypothetical protein
VAARRSAQHKEDFQWLININPVWKLVSDVQKSANPAAISVWARCRNARDSVLIARTFAGIAPHSSAEIPASSQTSVEFAPRFVTPAPRSARSTRTSIAGGVRRLVDGVQRNVGKSRQAREFDSRPGLDGRMQHKRQGEVHRAWPCRQDDRQRGPNHDGRHDRHGRWDADLGDRRDSADCAARRAHRETVEALNGLFTRRDVPMEGQMMQGAMMNGTMMICMVASTLLALIVAVTVIVQAVLLWKILGEVRKLKKP